MKHQPLPTTQRFITKFILLFFLSTIVMQGIAQNSPDSTINRQDTTLKQQKPVIQALDSVKSTDSTTGLKDSLSVQAKDSLPPKPKLPSLPSQVFVFRNALAHNPWFNFLGTPISNFTEEHKPASEDGLFYLLVGIVLYFALVRIFFYRYLHNLVSLFFRGSMRQQQIREQLSQTPLPSLLLNLLFAITTGLFVCFLARYYQLAIGVNFWLLLIDCCVLAGILYTIKFLVLKMTGWIFNIPKATDTYIFIVFMVNKLLGILLIPVLIVLFYSTPSTREVALVVSFFLVGFLFLYRFIAAYPSVRNEIKISIFYFFLYLCAFEIAPLLLIYKVLLTYLEKAY